MNSMDVSLRFGTRHDAFLTIEISRCFQFRHARRWAFFQTIIALRSLRCAVEENKKFKVNSMNFVRRFLISASCQGLFISRSCFGFCLGIFGLLVLRFKTSTQEVLENSTRTYNFIQSRHESVKSSSLTSRNFCWIQRRMSKYKTTHWL